MPLLVLLLAFFAAPPGTNKTATLVLRVEQIENAVGSLWIGVYESEDDFLDRDKARLVRHKVTTTGCERVHIDKLVVGKRYAIAVFQDLNDNGELDTNFLGLPAEPWALSQSLRSWFRRPQFGEMSFVFDPDVGLPPLVLR